MYRCSGVIGISCDDQENYLNKEFLFANPVVRGSNTGDAKFFLRCFRFEIESIECHVT